MVTIRPAVEKDVTRITEIYNEAILTTVATFDTEEKSLEDRVDWFRAHKSIHPVLVAELNGNVIGYLVARDILL